MASHTQLGFKVSEPLHEVFADFGSYLELGDAPVSSLVRMLAEEQAELVQQASENDLMQLLVASNRALHMRNRGPKPILISSHVSAGTFEVYDQAANRTGLRRSYVARAAVTYGLVKEMQAEKFVVEGVVLPDTL